MQIFLRIAEKMKSVGVSKQYLPRKEKTETETHMSNEMCQVTDLYGKLWIGFLISSKAILTEALILPLQISWTGRCFDLLLGHNY